MCTGTKRYTAPPCPLLVSQNLGAQCAHFAQAWGTVAGSKGRFEGVQAGLDWCCLPIGTGGHKGGRGVAPGARLLSHRVKNQETAPPPREHGSFQWGWGQSEPLSAPLLGGGRDRGKGHRFAALSRGGEGCGLQGRRGL